ncbi:hypothetical protein [Pseudooceanicola sp.]|uniref:hypothetical protein n=1 Tax=Pseudooceanicola sp. TaxID=1914328 RepID=UPI0026179DD9|nr:hypothetical protein [Pseudooceanicola sp.]MDF1854345.1 hypothetical protein [Pseudooceanicola sp.]
MTLQNRVLPSGEIVAIPARGTFTGNRGVLHDDQRRLGRARWRHKAWIICALQFKDVHRIPMTPGRWTELFFLDEAVALAAGHRPCAYCRRADYNAYRAAWSAATGVQPSAPEMDQALHANRVRRDRSQIRVQAPAQDLPSGSFILWNDAPHLIHDGQLYHYTPDGYDAILTLPKREVTVLTPRPSLAVLASGFSPKLHQSATG